MNHGSLFSGIGGFDLAASRVGLENVFQIEIDKFCQLVLKKNFPNAKRYSDIRDFDGSQYAGAIDIISGGFPCQPFSVAGQRKGKGDDRALWPEMLRVIRTIRPAWVVGENVAGIVSLELDAVLSDMEGIGYTCQAFVIPACAVNAIHRRDRVWIVAHAKSPIGEKSKLSRDRRAGYTDQGSVDIWVTPNSNCARREKLNMSAEPKKPGFNSGLSDFAIEWQPADTSDILRTAYGIPGRVDGRTARIKALGNAIVPQVAYEIFQAINNLYLNK